MESDEKTNLINGLAEKLKEHADKFGLGTEGYAEVARNIVENFAKYAAYRDGDEWEKEEGYKWDFIKDRFQEQNEQAIPGSLPGVFFDSIGNLCGHYRVNLFIDGQTTYKTMWKEYQETNDSYLNKVLASDNVEEKIRKANELIIKVAERTTTQSMAVLLFYLYPKTFFPYNHTSLTKTAENWGILKVSPLRQSGDECYLAWVNFIKDIVLPVLGNELARLKAIAGVPLGIPLDVQDFIYWLNKQRQSENSANRSSQTQTGVAMHNEFSDILKKLRANKQLILTGSPGTGKTYLAQRLAACMISEKTDGEPQNMKEIDKQWSKLEEDLNSSSPSSLSSRYRFVQFHPGYDYSDFVIGLKPKLINEQGQEIVIDKQNKLVDPETEKPLPKTTVSFGWADGIFKNLCEAADKVKENNFVIVIDEINRADLSRVFGELFSCLEEDYRGKNKVVLPNGELFTIPENVYIIGTMNDIDRSVESMDFALRRRFAWHEITAEDSEHIIDAISITGDKSKIVEEAKKRMQRLNNALEKEANLGAEYKLGGAYFKKIEKYCEGGTANWNDLWKNHLEVILREYLRGRKNAKDILSKLKKTYESEPTQVENATP